MRLSGEFGAPLATTCTEDGAASASAHTQTEAVHFGAATVVGLEGALAHDQISTVNAVQGCVATPKGRNI